MLPMPFAPPPHRVMREGRFTRIEPLEAVRHAEDLWGVLEGRDRVWDYMTYGPFADFVSFEQWLGERDSLDDPMVFTVVDRANGRARGLFALMAVRPAMGVLEIGHVLFSPEMQRTRLSTEAIYLAARYAFDELGYRRVEWKCNELNEGSKSAALRFGFRREGLFRKHMVWKGKTRDTAWYAMIDDEWPERRKAFESWLSDENFDAEGGQIRPLRDFMAG
jgi:RimJ/RimL family protein N-acetyltransferase